MVTSPYQYVVETGVIIPDTSSLLSDTQTEYKAVLGSDLVVTADTPQGVLITADTLTRADTVNNNAALANEINPNYAGGVFLDAIMALTGMQRTAATKTIVSAVELTGVPATVISQGTQAKTAAGDVFETLSAVTLDASGEATVDFASLVYGATPCTTSALNTIVTNVLGWETVNNPTAGVLGTSTQSDQAARALRNNTLAFQGVSLAEAITSALYATEGVTSLTFRENYESSPVGMLVSVTGGATLSGTIWGLSTTGDIVVGTDAMAFIESLQSLPSPNPFPIAAFTTTANIALTGLATQGGGDWSGSLTGGDIILVKNQTAPEENGVWVADASTWARQAYNPDGDTILGSIDGISMVRNSVWACVDGGSDTNVAAALLENKSSGAAWNGDATVAVIEPASGQSYDVQFDRPEVISILVKVTTSNGNTSDIIQAVLDYANGLLDGLAGFVVGADVSPFEISGAIVRQFPSYYISKVELSLISPSYSATAIPIALNEIAYTQSSYITVVVA